MYYDLNPVEKEGERNIWCRYYDGCLDHAVEENWRCWDCSKCQHFSNQELYLQAAFQEENQSILYNLPR
jgi:hypothetical protein